MPDEVIVKVFSIDEILCKIIKLCGTGFERIATLKSVNQVTNKKTEINKKKSQVCRRWKYIAEDPCVWNVKKLQIGCLYRCLKINQGQVRNRKIL